MHALVYIVAVLASVECAIYVPQPTRVQRGLLLNGNVRATQTTLVWHTTNYRKFSCSSRFIPFMKAGLCAGNNIEFCMLVTN